MSVWLPRALAAFRVRVRDEVDLVAVRHGLLAAVRDTVQPARPAPTIPGVQKS